MITTRQLGVVFRTERGGPRLDQIPESRVTTVSYVVGGIKGSNFLNRREFPL